MTESRSFTPLKTVSRKSNLKSQSNQVQSSTTGGGGAKTTTKTITETQMIGGVKRTITRTITSTVNEKKTTTVKKSSQQ